MSDGPAKTSVGRPAGASPAPSRGAGVGARPEQWVEGPGGGPSDEEVVRRVLAGDVDAFERLVERYGDVMYRHAERMVGDADEAADLVQAAFVRGYRSLSRCEPARVGGWLFRIVSNLCKDHLKSPRRNRVALDDRPDLPATDRGGPEETLDRRELARELEWALARLTPEQREAFVLKHHEGFSYEEMSEMLGVPGASLKMRAHRAREALRHLLEGRT